MIEIDGSMGEGGGQILRSALAFSALLGVPVRIYNIRAKRRPPGLKPNHLTTVKAIAEITRAEVKGLRLGSREIVFKPRTIVSGKFFFDIGTAGSIPLVLQAILPVLAFAPGRVEVTIRGGTAVPFSPPIHYLERVFFEALRRMGVVLEMEIKRMGYYPRGGGLVTVVVDPVEYVLPIRLERLGKPKFRGFVFISNLPDRIVGDIIRSATEYIRERLGKPVEFESKRYPALDKGCGGLIYAIDEGIIGADQLCKKGVHATKIGRMLAEKFVKEIESNAAADRHLADHLIIRSSIARGKSVIKTSEITSHTQTQLDLLKIFLPEVPVRVDGTRIEIEGIGLTRSKRLKGERFFTSKFLHMMLSKFYVSYKHRKAAIVLRLILLIILAPYAGKTLQKVSVEESQYLPENVESIEGNELMSQLFTNVSFSAAGVQVVISKSNLTWEDFLQLRSLAQQFVEAGYAENFSTPIEKASLLLGSYGAFLSGQAVYENGTITAMYLTVEVYVGVRSNVYASTGNHQVACEQALNNSLLIAESLSQALGNRTIARIEAFHQMRLESDPNVLATNPLGYADAYIDTLAPNFGPYTTAAAKIASIYTWKTRDSKINELLNATVPATALVTQEPEQAIYDLFTRPIDMQEIMEKAMAKGYVEGLVMGTFAPSGMDPKNLRERLGISKDFSTAYASVLLKSESDDFLRSVWDRREGLEKPDYVYLTGVSLMRLQIKDKAEESTHNLHLYDILIIMIILAIVFRALPASVGPVLIIGSAIILAEGILYRLNVRFDVAITQMGISVMITAMLGAGVDYAVFMSSRYVEERGRGKSKDEAVKAAIEHAGRSLLTSGGTIAIAFGVLALSSFKSLQGMGIAVALGIGMSVLTALVLIPAVFGALGDKFFRPRKMQYKKSRFYSVGRRVLRHKKAVLLLIVIPFGALSYVALNAETSYDMIALMPDVPSKTGLKILMDKFGSFMMPVFVLVNVGNNTDEIATIDSLIASTPGVVDVRSYAHPLSYYIEPKTMFRKLVAEQMRSGFLSDGRSLHIVIIKYNPYTEEAFNVVKDIRAKLSGYEHYVTGVAAMYYDISQIVNEDFQRLTKIVITAIILFLTIVFGSILIPLRLEGTVLMNIGGTLGLVYLILQFINEPLGRVIPISLFVILNGLGMDYDIFLVTRIMEERAKGRNDDEAIIEAVANTMRVITACGIIMAASFGMLILTGFPLTMQLGLGLSMAVIFDTFIMRSFFVPAFMSIAGKRNRWAPRVLKKVAMYKVE